MNNTVKFFTAILAGCIFSSCTFENRQKYSSGQSMMIEPGDFIETIVDKAALVRPSERQVRWQELEFTAFIHFGVNTFTGRGWGTGEEHPDQFAPTDFDAGQWIDVFKAAGMKGVVLTAKHHDGFCLWPTETTEHSIKNSRWRNGQGDIVKEVSEACRREGLAFGVYLSPWDRNTQEFGKPGYNKIFQQQIRELLTNYGEVYDVWFDGAHAPKDNPEIFDWSGHFRLIRELQPGAVISIMGPDVRWCGNEGGGTRESNWNVVGIQSSDPLPAEKSQETTEAIIKGVDPKAKDIGSPEQLSKAKQLIWLPAVTNTSIRPEWFYHERENTRQRSLSNLLDLYYRTVGGNTQLLLNVPPDKRGLIHEKDAHLLREMGKILRMTFGTNLASGAKVGASSALEKHAAQNVLDGNTKTFWTSEAGIEKATIEFELTEPKTFNVIMLQEYIRSGQRIEAFSIEVKEEGDWKTIAEATTIGHKRLLRCEDVTAQDVRVVIESSRLSPMLANFGLYMEPKVLAAPEIQRDKDGLITLNAEPGISIHYTTDGSEPTVNTTIYDKPFDLQQGGLVRAISIPDESFYNPGLPTESSMEFGIMKSKWKVHSLDAKTNLDKHENTLNRAFDDNIETFLSFRNIGNNKYPHEIVIDLGETLTTNGFIYTPRQSGKGKEVIETYEVYISDSPNKWGKVVSAGQFDNVVNNPIPQVIRFENEATGRYLKFIVPNSPSEMKGATIAEIDILVK
jgi:alpha-L-fucosidase